MEPISIVLLIIILLYVLRTKRQVRDLGAKIDGLRNLLNQGKRGTESNAEKTQEAIRKSSPYEKWANIEEEQKVQEDLVLAEKKSEATPIPISEDPKKLEIQKEEPVKPKVQIIRTSKLEPIHKTPKSTFMERNPDLERFIGENLLSKIGIVIFVIGMGFLVRKGIENNQITEVMRVAIGILISGGMIGLGHYLRKSFGKFSAILIGGALAVLYFTIALAYHQYALISQTAAFVIMVFITSLGVLLSISYNRKALAVLALIGGFGTPFFVSDGSGNYVTMLTYIIVLDLGMMVLVYFKKWNIVNYLTYAFTYLLYSGVFVEKYLGNVDETRANFFLFLTAFYLIFFVMSIVYNVKNKRQIKMPEIAMLMTNSALYLGFGLSISDDFHGGLYSGLFTALIAVFNFIFLLVLYKRKDVDANLIYLLILLVLTFVTLIAPIQLEGNNITLFWAAESIVLLFIAQKSKIEPLRLLAVVISMLMLLSLGMDWGNNYIPFHANGNPIPFLNTAFLSSFAAIISLAGMVTFFKEPKMLQFKWVEFWWKPSYIKVLLALVVFVGIFLELNDQFLRAELSNTLRMILLGIYTYSCAIGMVFLEKWKPNPKLKVLNLIVNVVCILSYMTFFVQQVSWARDGYLALEVTASSGFFVHYILLALFLILVVLRYREVHEEYGFKSEIGSNTLWPLAFIIIFVCSVEAGHLSVIHQFGNGLNGDVVYQNAVRYVYPVVWAITALFLMIVGMKYKLKTLRLASLIIFAITIIKLVFYDLRGNATGKIIAFIVLGVVLLLISFLYQKLKFIIQDDDSKV
ncbi:MAG: putative membrane protein [Bacteroidia bacterium]|jgi:uncharacterized membrane protein